MKESSSPALIEPSADRRRIRIRAPAKINLCLHVGAKRPDGYHDLESLVVFAAFGDELLIERDRGFSLAIGGPFAEDLSRGDDNLVLKAARLLAARARADIGARFILTKRIPPASGVGGGSADAAAALRGLARLWNLRVSNDEMQTIAAVIGSDVPVCLDSKVAWMEGRGERVRSLRPLPGMSMILVNPKVQVSTAEVFRRLRQRRGTGFSPPPSSFAEAIDLVRYLQSTTNDLEPAAAQIAPVIGEVLEEIRRLPGVLLARMSGSGATCFGLMKDAESDRESIRGLRQRYRDWWVVETVLPPPQIAPAEI